jgi:hypothetical protein
MGITQSCQGTFIGSTISILCASVVFAAGGCVYGPSKDAAAEALRTPEGLAQWQRDEATMHSQVQLTRTSYEQDMSLEHLKGYEAAVRDYLDHGFALYRAYRASNLPLAPDLVPSLERRINLLMDVADEYIKQGLLVVGEGIAADVVHNYADLPAMAPAQRRAEAVLMRYRYRQDY